MATLRPIIKAKIANSIFLLLRIRVFSFSTSTRERRCIVVVMGLCFALGYRTQHQACRAAHTGRKKRKFVTPGQSFSVFSLSDFPLYDQTMPPHRRRNSM